MGRRSSHESVRRPGKSQTAVSQARLTPRIVVRTATPAVRTTVLSTRRVSMVETRCPMTSPEGLSDADKTAAMGTATRTAATIAETVQPSGSLILTGKVIILTCNRPGP